MELCRLKIFRVFNNKESTGKCFIKERMAEMNRGMETGFIVFGVMFGIVFVLIIGVFIAVAVRDISRWNKNNNSPRLTVYAMVVSKRTHNSYHHDNNMHEHAYTTYYVTFQVASGDRMELQVEGEEFGMLVEGDNGQLSFQGTRYLGFQRV